VTIYAADTLCGHRVGKGLGKLKSRDLPFSPCIAVPLVDSASSHP
jgi:hypothetical protein